MPLLCRRPVEHVITDGGGRPKPRRPRRWLHHLRREVVGGTVRAVAQLAADRCRRQYQRVGVLRIARGYGQQTRVVRVAGVPAGELPRFRAHLAEAFAPPIRLAIIVQVDVDAVGDHVGHRRHAIHSLVARLTPDLAAQHVEVVHRRFPLYLPSGLLSRPFSARISTDTATTETYSLSLPAPLPISLATAAMPSIPW